MTRRGQIAQLWLVENRSSILSNLRSNVLSDTVQQNCFALLFLPRKFLSADSRCKTIGLLLSPVETRVPYGPQHESSRWTECFGQHAKVVTS